MPTGALEEKTKRYGWRGKAGTVGAILGAGILGAALVATPNTGIQTGVLHAQDLRTPPSFADLADRVRPAVVSVNVRSTSGRDVASGDFPMPDLPSDHPLREFFDQFKRQQPERRPTRAQGSGFLISADGFVVTNHHVADKADEIEVSFENEEKYKATVVGSDARTDIALLKIQGNKTFDRYLPFAKTPPRVGDWVLAVGNPYGLGGTVTAGIVSASGRDIGSGPYDFLQIDAAVNKGNSGGPAVNLNGEVVGVNTAIYSPSGGSVGIAFAVPASTAQDVVEKLRRDGKVSSGWLGVQIQSVDDALAESLGLKSTKGALVAKILPDGPAAKSQLRAQDLILRVNNTPINSSRELARVIAALSPNQDAQLRVVRNGTEMDVTVKLGEYPSGDKQASLRGEGGQGRELEDLGLTLVPASEFPGSRTKEGVAVSAVDPASKAADQGLRRGDIITEVQGKPVSSPQDVADGIKDARDKGRRNVLLQVRSRDAQRFLTLPVDAGDSKNKGRR
jgi:serine protease Do